MHLHLFFKFVCISFKYFAAIHKLHPHQIVHCIPKSVFVPTRVCFVMCLSPVSFHHRQMLHTIGSFGLIVVLFFLSLSIDLGNHTSTDGHLPLADGETETVVDGGGVDEFHSHLHVVSGHAHRCTLELDLSSDVGRSDEKLRSK